MRILIITQYFWPETFKINDLVEQLGLRGHKITVLTGKPNYPVGALYPDFKDDPKKYSKFNNVIKVHRIPMILRGQNGFKLFINYISFALSSSIYALINIKSRDYDCIFVYEPSPISVGLASSLLYKFKKIPVLFWVQDLWPDTLDALNVVKSPFLLGLINKLASFIYRNSTLVLCQSREFISKININNGIDPTKLRYFPNWAEDYYFDSDISPAPEIILEKDKFTVLFAGNFGDAQDFHSILESILKLKDKKIRWIFLGQGKKYLWFKEKISEFNLKNILLLGSYPQERMPSFFSHADAFLISLQNKPVFSLTVPNKLQSYLSFGKPILGMINGEGAKIIQESGSGLVANAGDYNDLSKNIIKLENMTLLERNQMGKNGKIFSLNEFKRDKLLDNLEFWMSEITNNISSNERVR